MNHCHHRSSAFIAFLFLALSGLPAAYGQSSVVWKTVRNKEAGVSVRLPAGASLKTSHLTTRTGDKLLLLNGQGIGQEGMMYAVMVTRANRAEKGQHGSVLEDMQKSYMQWIFDAARKDPKRYTAIRQPITRFGMKGEEIISTDAGTGDAKSAFIHIQIIKDPKNYIFLLATERARTVDSKKRMRDFFASFTIAPGNKGAKMLK